MPRSLPIPTALKRVKVPNFCLKVRTTTRLFFAENIDPAIDGFTYDSKEISQCLSLPAKVKDERPCENIKANLTMTLCFNFFHTTDHNQAVYELSVQLLTHNYSYR